MNDIRSRILRRRIPDSVRRALYTTAAPLITILAAGGLIPGNQAAAWTSLTLAAITLVVAVVNSESGWRNSVYLTTGALQAVLQGYGIGTDAMWASITGLVLALLGIGLAGAFAPSGQAGEVPAGAPLQPTALPAVHAV
ncbi:hypothetical protein [Tsukamurella sp. 1534]|uniref:phage holin n=1 Tax=Tsukamurella sp. 1534 TaxID=1151061 RepID=UPI000316C2E6|nr:hypothetical protein [Tsukamurella sp. 1534]